MSEIDEKALEEIQEASDDKSVDPETLCYFEIVQKNNGDHQASLFEYCYIKNIFYNSELAKKILKNKDDSIYMKLPQIYVDSIKEDFRYKDLNFLSQLKRENFEKIYSENLDLLSLTEDDRRSRQEIISIFGYDPFKSDKADDRPQLYRDLSGMITENMRKDIAKQKAALSIVRSYQNIENYQKKVNELTTAGSIDEETQKQLDSYLKVISSIQSTINQTAEKNNFTAKGIGSSGKGMLSDVLNQVGVQVVDDAVVNYYDISTSKAISEVADISWKSMLNQVNLSKTDYVDILTNQANLVRESIKIAKKAEEEARIAKAKIVKQQLIDELEYEYRQKGIDEEEIKEFISREFHLHDGNDE